MSTNRSRASVAPGNSPFPPFRATDARIHAPVASQGQGEGGRGGTDDGDALPVDPAPASRPAGVGSSPRYGLDLITPRRQRARLFDLIAHAFPKADDQPIEEIYAYRRRAVLDIIATLSRTAESIDDLTFLEAGNLIDALADIVEAGA